MTDPILTCPHCGTGSGHTLKGALTDTEKVYACSGCGIHFLTSEANEAASVSIYISPKGVSWEEGLGPAKLVKVDPSMSGNRSPRQYVGELGKEELKALYDGS